MWAISDHHHFVVAIEIPRASAARQAVHARPLVRLATHVGHFAESIASTRTFQAVLNGAGITPPHARAGKRTGHKLDALQSDISINKSSVGRALGAASLPLLANFAIDRDVLFKDAE